MYEDFEKVLKEKGLSRKTVSDATGVSQSTLSEWKHGKTIPKASNLEKLSKFLDVPVSLLSSDGNGESYHLDNESVKTAEMVANRPDLRILLEAAEKLSRQDVLDIVKIVEKIQK